MESPFHYSPVLVTSRLSSSLLQHYSFPILLPVTSPTSSPPAATPSSYLRWQATSCPWQCGWCFRSNNSSCPRNRSGCHSAMVEFFALELNCHYVTRSLVKQLHLNFQAPAHISSRSFSLNTKTLRMCLACCIRHDRTLLEISYLEMEKIRR